MGSGPVAASPRKRLIILGSLWLSLVVVLIAFRGVVLFFATAAIIAYLVAPLVQRMTSVHWRGQQLPRWSAILIIYALFFCALYLAAIALVPQLYREMARVSRDAMEYVNSLTPQKVQQLAQNAEAWMSQHGLPVELSSRSLQVEEPDGAFAVSLDLEKILHGGIKRLSEFIQANVLAIVTQSQRIVGGAVMAVFMMFFVLMVAAYMSIDAQKIQDYARGLVPPEWTSDIKVLVERVDRSLSGVVRGQAMICLVNGVLTLIGLLLFKVKFAFLLATVATLLSAIPIFGSIISSVPIVMISLSQSWQSAVAMLLWLIGIHAVEAYLLNPKILGSSARIHPVVVAFALIAGERSFGLTGALFAVPVAAIAVACFDFARQKAMSLPTKAAEAAPTTDESASQRTG